MKKGMEILKAIGGRDALAKHFSLKGPVFQGSEGNIVFQIQKGYSVNISPSLLKPNKYTVRVFDKRNEQIHSAASTSLNDMGKTFAEISQKL